jgi:hypothetical protein|nr:MAG TPA: red chlorophyll catabolite reductase [Caudoviricetes sp.]
MMDEFIKTVQEMRKCQKEYFKTRDKVILAKSKELERKVDNMLSNLASNMPNLFQ